MFISAGIECQQAVVVAGTERIRNFAGALTWFTQEHLQHLKNRTTEPIYPQHLVLFHQVWIFWWSMIFLVKYEFFDKVQNFRTLRKNSYFTQKIIPYNFVLYQKNCTLPKNILYWKLRILPKNSYTKWTGAKKILCQATILFFRKQGLIIYLATSAKG